MIKNKGIREEERELYCYAISSLCMELSPLLLSSCIGLLFDCVCSSVLIIIPFMSIRKFSGGYHTHNLWSCILLSTASLLIFVKMSQCILPCGELFLVVVLCSISIIMFSPIENKNKPLGASEQKIYGKKARIRTCIFFSIMLLQYILGYRYTISTALGIILTAVMQIPCIYQNISKKQKRKYKE